MKRPVGLPILVISLALRANAAVLTVDPGGGGDFMEIQPALDAAKDGDSVVVKPAEYVIEEPIDFNRLHAPDDPASPPVKDIVVRSANGPSATTIRMTRKPGVESRESVVIFRSGESRKSLLDGFTLTGGQTTWYGGAGILLLGASSPTVANCTIGENIAHWSAHGGGVHCGGTSSPEFTNCTIRNNRVTRHGGGVSCADSSSPIFRQCTISENVISDGENDGSDSGGGIICWGDASPTFLACTISGNSSCGRGGGVYCSSRGELKLISCVITRNAARSEDDGDGLDIRRSAPVITNCTIHANGTREVYCDEGASPVFLNCIVWNDVGYSPFGTDSSARPSVSHSCLQAAGRWPGAGNTDQDPLFVGPGDVRLQPGSPCIDAGTLDGASTTDIEGHGRPCGEGVDIGAYEFGDCAAPADRFRRADVDGSGGIEITDPVSLLLYLFGAGSEPPCLDAADAQDDGELDISDALYSLSFQFRGGRLPQSPFPACGLDPTIDALGCAAYPACE